MWDAILAIFDNVFSSPVSMFALFAFVGALLALLIGWIFGVV